MKRKVLLSFLGVNNYTACNYYDEIDPLKKITNVKYIQEAIVQLYCKEFNTDDRLIFFLTSAAKEMNWDNRTYKDHRTQKMTSNIGLQNRLLQLPGIEPSMMMQVGINEGFNTTQFWEIFTTIFDSLQQNDEVILDITHGFRSLPMLGIVLLNYAKTLKNIQITGIYYGAFEALGPNYKVVDMPIEERNAPILNLISFSRLQEWAIAANDFTQHGVSDGIKDMVKSKQSNENRDLQKFADQLNAITKSMSTVRGAQIRKGKIFKNMVSTMGDLKGNENIIPPLRPLIEKIETKINDFNKTNNTLNGFTAVEWCINHNLTQQGITFLQEFLVIHMLLKVQHNFDRDNEFFKALMKTCLKVEAGNFSHNGDKKRKKYFNIFHSMDIVTQIRPHFIKLSKMRNDINHAGMNNDAQSYNSFTKELKNTYREIKSILINFEKI